MKTEVIITESELPSDVVEAIRAGRKIEAIQLLRESKDLGLANAKVLVDRASQTLGPRRKRTSFADRPQGLSNLVKSLGMVLVVMAAYYFYTTP